MPDMNKPQTIGELRASRLPRPLRQGGDAQEPHQEDSARARPSSPTSSATRRPSSPRSRTPSSPARTSSCSASAARPRPASPASLVTLLDEEVPAIAGCEINDDPFDPICQRCRATVEDEGDDAPIEWIGRDRRYGEKLATPDITIADLIGEVDPIKVAEGRYLSDELTIHYGLIPRTNRGIFCINELPDLAERIQVGLLNVMEERDVQIRGYKVRLPLDLYVVASANPEDYTNRGRIITPLKDRFGSQVRTHYPRTIDHEIAIMDSGAHPLPRRRVEVTVPAYMKEIVAEITHLARKSPDISQRSGVSVRVSITNYENLLSNALKRAIRLGESEAAPRVSDLPAVVASMTGKIEVEALGDSREERIVDKLVHGRRARRSSTATSTPRSSTSCSRRFDSGLVVEVSREHALGRATSARPSTCPGMPRRRRRQLAAPGGHRPAQPSRRPPPPSSSSWRGSTSPASSTRTARPASCATGGSHALPILALGRLPVRSIPSPPNELMDASPTT